MRTRSRIRSSTSYGRERIVVDDVEAESFTVEGVGIDCLVGDGVRVEAASTTDPSFLGF